jgi:membrane protein YdbS with pleckstrin-like domain
MDQESMDDAGLEQVDPEATSSFPTNEETDLWWDAYAGRTLLPHFLASVVTSTLIVFVAWSLGAWRGEWIVHHVSLSLVAALWLCIGGYWAFHVLTFTYRLTNRRLFISRGFRFRSPADPGVPLERIVEVSAQRRPIERLVGVGRVHIKVQGNEQPAVYLKGVRAPKRVANRIRKAIAQARMGKT